MKLLLINASFFPETPNIGLAYLMASAKKRHTVNLLDIGFQYKNYKEYITSGLEEFKPDVVGISVLTPGYALALNIAKLVKKAYPKAQLLFGGVHCTLNPEMTIKHPLVDAVCIGEGEEAIVEYLDRLEQDKKQEVAGIWYKDSKGGIIKNKLRPFKSELDEIPFPDWDYWEIEKYAGMGDYYPNSLIHISSRGCPYNCAFCTNPAIAKAVPGPYYRLRSPKNVVEEIEFNWNRYNKWFKNIFFNDEIFGLNKDNFEGLCGLFIASGLNRKLTWTCQTRADVITRDWAKRAREAGCVMVFLGLESGDEYLRRNILKKNISDQDVVRAVTNLEDHDIPYKFTMIIGFPYENKKAAEKSFAMAKNFNSIRTDFLYYQPFPHTELSQLVGGKDSFPYRGITKKEDHVSKLIYVWVKMRTKSAEFKRQDLAWIMTKTRLFKIFKFLKQGITLKGLRFLFDVLKFILSINNCRKRPLTHPAVFGELYQATVSKYIWENHKIYFD